MRSFHKIFLMSLLIVLVVAGILPGFLEMGRQSADAAACSLDVFWRWTDGKDYTTPPAQPKIGETVRAVAKFNNCQPSSKPYFIFFKPSGQEQVGLASVTANYMEQNAALVLDKGGQYYFKVVVPDATGGPYEKESTKFTTARLGPACEVTLNFDANPKTLDSLDQILELKAIIGQTLNSCGITSLDVEFYRGNVTLVEKKQISLSGRQLGKEVIATTTAGKLGGKMDDNLSFTTKVKGNACTPIYGTAVPICQKIDITSTTVNVGVGKAPDLVQKYSCNKGGCVIDPNGKYTSMAACLAECGVGVDPDDPDDPGGPGGRDSFEFELPNPIGINTFEELVNVIGAWIFNLAIPVAVIVIIYAGILMLTAGGNPGQFKKGAEALKYAVIGLAVVLIGKGFVTLIKSILSLRNP